MYITYKRTAMLLGDARSKIWLVRLTSDGIWA